MGYSTPSMAEKGKYTIRKRSLSNEKIGSITPKKKKVYIPEIIEKLVKHMKKDKKLLRASKLLQQLLGTHLSVSNSSLSLKAIQAACNPSSRLQSQEFQKSLQVLLKLASAKMPLFTEDCQQQINQWNEVIKNHQL